MSKRALVLGSQGYVAGHLINALLQDESYSNIIGITRNKGFLPRIPQSRYEEWHCPLNHASWVKQLCSQYQPDIVFHFATGSKPSEDTYLDDINITYYLIKGLPINTRFVYASSTKVYGSYCCECKEFCEPINTQNLNFYAASKMSCENLVRFRSPYHTILRFGPIIGKDLKYGAVHELVEKVRNTQDGIICAKDNVIRKYLHLADAVGALQFVADKKVSGTFNVNADNGMSIQRLVEIISGILHKDVKIDWLGNQNVQFNVLPNNEMLQYSGFRYKFNMVEEAVENGLRDYIHG